MRIRSRLSLRDVDRRRRVSRRRRLLEFLNKGCDGRLILLPFNWFGMDLAAVVLEFLSSVEAFLPSPEAVNIRTVYECLLVSELWMFR